MKIYRLKWEKYDWNAYHVLGFNFVQDFGVIYATTEDKAISSCPITAQEGNIEIVEIEVLE